MEGAETLRTDGNELKIDHFAPARETMGTGRVGSGRVSKYADDIGLNRMLILFM